MSAESPSPECFSKQERVYYEDTDAGGVVYHSNYLNFMERCRCEWLDSLGFNIAVLQEELGVMFVVHAADLKFLSPGRLFDELTVTVQVLQVSKVKLVVEQKIYNGDRLLCRGVITLASLHKSSFQLTRLPDALQQALMGELIDKNVSLA